MKISSPTRFLVALLLCGILQLSLSAADIPGSQLSAERLQEISSLTALAMDSLGPDAEEDKILANITKAFLTRHPDFAQPNRTPLVGEEDIEKLTEEDMEKQLDKFFHLPNQQEQLTLAELRYPLYKRGDTIKIVYKRSPTLLASVEGVVQEIVGGYVRLSGRQIRIKDMQGIVGNENEILKLDARKTEELRAEFLGQLLEGLENQRRQWREDNAADYQEKHLRLAGIQNEKNGYTEYHGQWLNHQELLPYTVPEFIADIQRLKQQQGKIRLDNIRESLKNTLLAKAASETRDPQGLRIKPQDELARRAAEQAAKEAAELAKKEAEQEEKLAAEARAKEAEEAKLRLAQEREQKKLAAAQEKRRQELAEKFKPLEEEKSNLVPLCITTVAIFIAAFIAYLLWQKYQERGNDVSKFFSGKGKLQKDFWGKADANPEGFKYVAYLFPTMNDANNALARLTYISIDNEGHLRCKKDIDFGAYPHMGQAVAFVGGENLNYALWREASGMWPELTGAAYFKVSEEPKVNLEVPNMDEFSSEGNAKIVSAGIEDITMETGEIFRCFKYEAEDSTMALAFLDKFEISEEGVMVHVSTKEGVVYGKDINGIFEV